MVKVNRERKGNGEGEGRCSHADFVVLGQLLGGLYGQVLGDHALCRPPRARCQYCGLTRTCTPLRLKLAHRT